MVMMLFVTALLSLATALPTGHSTSTTGSSTVPSVIFFSLDEYARQNPEIEYAEQVLFFSLQVTLMQPCLHSITLNPNR